MDRPFLILLRTRAAPRWGRRREAPPEAGRELAQRPARGAAYRAAPTKRVLCAKNQSAVDSVISAGRVEQTTGSVSAEKMLASFSSSLVTA